MPPRPFTGFHAFALEQLQRAQPTTAKRMFGGVGVYHAGVCFALMDDDALWLKADALTQPDFEARSMGPFLPFGPGGPSMQYWQLPEDVLEDIDALRTWCDKAIAVAQRARKKRAAKPASGKQGKSATRPKAKRPKPKRPKRS
jgi:DNA transformation protein and related proteins